MKTKRILALVLALVMVFALAACAKNEGETGTKTNDGDTYELAITVWVPDAAVELTRKQIEDFNNTNEHGIKVTATIDALSEADSATQVLNDVNTAADMFFFAQDQFARLVRGGALSQVPSDVAAKLAEENNASVVAAGKSGDTQYAYPLTNDNGYFMYYDKSVIPEEDVDSLEKLIADCEKADKYFAFEQDTSAWYNASFFFGAGCHSNWILDDDGKIVAVDDDFNSDKGLIAVKGMEKLVKSPKFLSSSDVAEFANGAAIVVSGAWAYNDVQGILGDNLGATDLPSFNVDGKDYHLGSFSGCKLLGVKPQSDGDKASAIHMLAQYLTSEAAQLERFNTLAWGPANTAAAANEAVQANPALVALNLQNQYAVPQGQIDGAWWDIGKVISAEVKEAKSEDDLKAALENYYAKISAIFTMDESAKNAFSVIGAICGSNWDKDFPMTDNGDGTYTSEELELYKGDEFKFRKGASWDVNFGSDGQLNGPNFVVEESGKYVLTLTVAEDEGSATCDMNKLEALEDPAEGQEGDIAITGWTAIGTLNESNWDADFAMTEQADGTWTLVAELHAGEELKARKDGAWDENIGVNGAGGDNLVVEADGYYVIKLDPAAATLALEPVTWAAIGSIGGSNWDKDFPMTETEDGVFATEAMELHAGEELKVRAAGDWAVNFGTNGRDGDNLKVEADGNYIIRLILADATIEIVEG